jgi:EmrB/QacA subfamily drug resistance transporter
VSTAQEPAAIGFRRIIPLVVAIALFMENLDSTIIATALPVIATSLHVTPLNLSLAVSVYLLSLAVFIPMSGWMADRYGARNVFAAAIALFTISSALCGAAQSLPMLIGARALQGIGGAMMTPVGRLIIGRSFAKSDLITAMTYVTIPALVGPVLGPLVGGAITTYASWRWIFIINVPVGMVGVFFALRVIDNFRDPVVRRLDLIGFILLAVGLAGIVIGVENVGRGVLPAGAETALLAAAAAALLLYRRHAKRTEHPALDLRLFRIATFRASVVGGTICRLGFGATPLLLPLLFQLGFGLSPLGSGALTFTGAVGAMVMKAVATPMVRRFGFRRLLTANAVVVGAMIMGMASFTAGTPTLVIVAFLGCYGFFRALQFTCMGALNYADLDPRQMPSGTAIASVAQQISMSLGVAVGATVLEIVTRLSGAAGPETAAFAPTFLIIGLIPIASALIFARLPDQAGEEMSGHRSAAAKVVEPAFEPAPVRSGAGP